MFSSSKTWEVTWGGHKIIVENRTTFFIFSDGHLWIDGTEVKQPKVPFFTLDSGKAVSQELKGFINDGSRSVEILAHLGSISPGFRIGCVIYIDGELVGGDTDKKFMS